MIFEFKKKNAKKLLIFDLDETLIHCKRDELIEAEGTNNFAPEVNLEIENKEEGLNFKVSFSVRPFALECLAAANKFYEVAIFTAGHSWYANKIIDHLDPQGELI